MLYQKNNVKIVEKNKTKQKVNLFIVEHVKNLFVQII